MLTTECKSKIVKLFSRAKLTKSHHLLMRKTCQEYDIMLLAFVWLVRCPHVTRAKLE